MNISEERFNYYFELFTNASSPEERQKIIEEYTKVCFGEDEWFNQKGV